MIHLADYIDHTLLKPDATVADIKKVCDEAIVHGFKAVCVNGCYVPIAKEALKNTPVKVAAVIGFPLGAMSTKAKVFEAADCIGNGADEIDMVINIGWLKSKLYELQIAKDEEENKKTRSEKSEISWGNQIRSYVMQPYTMVKDHRTKKEISDVNSILNGNIHHFLEAQLILLN